MKAVAGILVLATPAMSQMTCGEIKDLYKSNECCGMPGKTVNMTKPMDSSCWQPAEALLPGVMPSVNGRPKYIMGIDIDYPPYAYTKTAPFGSNTDLDSPVGVGVDMIKAMGVHCGFDVEVVQAHWSDCWGNGEIGAGLLQGWYHGCMTYTHAAAVRNRYLEFTNSWARLNKPSGLIVKLTGGKPAISGNDDFSGKTIVDVTGWAPTADTLYFVKNQCTGAKYASDFTVVQGDDVTLPTDGDYPASMARGPNDKALLAVINGLADAMWVYGDQAANYHCGKGETKEGWNCELWNKFGTDFAYIQSGMFGWMHNGTTIAMAKKGSGIAAALDGCLDDFMQTEKFLETCKIEHGSPPHNQLKTCIPNEYFKQDPDWKPDNITKEPFMFPTSAMADGGHSCATGYCNCDETPPQ